MGKIIPLWKTGLSWLFDIRIDQAGTEPQKKIDLFVSKGQWKLITENAIYSYGLYYDNFDACFKHLKFPNARIKKICLLGGGMGSIIDLLEKKYQQKAEYTFVESNLHVLAMFEKYARHNWQSKIEIHSIDAFEFVTGCAENFDLICMDVFEDNIVPLPFQSNEFLEALKKILAPKGILIFNQLEETENQVKQIQEFKKIFTSIFQQHELLSIYTNRMFIATME